MSLKLKSLEAGSSSNESGRNKPNRLLQVGVVAVVAIVVYLGGQVLGYAPSAARADPTATAAPVVEAPTVEVTPTPTMLSGMAEPVFREEEVVETPQPIIMVVTASPTPTPTEVNYVYVEVTRMVEVTPISLPTATPTATPALPPGTVRICVDLEGATAVYVGNVGVVSGGCQQFNFGVGQTTIPVHVNR